MGKYEVPYRNREFWCKEILCRYCGYQTHKDYTNIIRSMSRAGAPTDNPIIKSLNGWIKEEMRIDFNLKSVEGIPSFIERYVHYFNNERLSYKLNYKNPCSI